MRHLKQHLALAAAVCAGSLGMYGQNTNSGDIRGTVTDPSGAVIPGVTVTVLDVDKGDSRTFTTDGAGLYDTGSIVPDHYKLTFTKSGFETLVRGPLTLDVGVQGINATLTLGNSTQEITVNTDTPLLDTESGAQEQTLTAQTMAQLPQVGADWQNFIWLQPGANGTPENAGTAVQPNAGQVSFNGNLPFEAVLQDGASSTLPMSQNADVTIFETTAEVKISDVGFSAQYGVGNVVYNQITKGGTDKFHGSAYEYFQNNALNAASYAFGQKSTVPFLRYDDFGFNVGGPVWKNKAFFFFDYDKTIQHGGAANGFATVPTAAIASGDFSAVGTNDLYDPTTQTIQQTGTHVYNVPGGTFTQPCPCVIRQTFRSEYGTNAIPAALQDKVSLATQKFFPTPNVPTPTISGGIPENNYFYNTPSTNPFTKYFGRFDYDVNSKNRFTATVTEGDNPATFLNQGICPINCQAGDVSRINSQVSDVWTFNQHFVNEARMGFTDQLNYYVPYTLGQGLPSKIGWQFAKADEFPNLTVNGFLGLNSPTNAVYKENVFDPSDVVTLIKGKHILHFGGEFLIERADSTNWGNLDPGDLTFAGNYTSFNGQTGVTLDDGKTGYQSGLGYADFLLGQSQQWGANISPEYGARQKVPQLFVQDDIKLTPSLTVNLGVRWEANTGWSEVKGNETTFDPTVLNPGTNTNGAIWYGTTKANGRGQLVAPQYNIWLPRAGFAWSFLPNTVLRGSFGIYAGLLSEDTYGGGMGSAFSSSGGLNDNNSTHGICPVVQFSGVSSAPDTTDPGCGVGSFNSTTIDSVYLTAPTSPSARNTGFQSPGYTMYHTPVPKNYQWTLQAQRQFGNSFVFDLAYVGNHGSNLNFPVDINQVPLTGLQFGPNNQSYRPYPIYGSIGGSTNNAVSNYNALQTEIRKRLSYGLEFDVNYVWSHMLDDQDSSGWGSREGYQNYQYAYDPSANYGRSNFDIRNAFKGSVIYTLPFGKGALFLNKSWIADEVLGGWRVSSTFVMQTGNPMGITTGSSNTSYNGSGNYTQFPNVIGDWHKSGSNYSRLSEWYNTAAFTVPAAGTYGNLQRNSVTGPDLTDMNASLGKTFDLWPERGVRFELRGEAFNVLNHPSFGQSGSNAIGASASQNATSSAVINSVTVGGRTMQLYGKITF